MQVKNFPWQFNPLLDFFFLKLAYIFFWERRRCGVGDKIMSRHAGGRNMDMGVADRTDTHRTDTDGSTNNFP